MQFKLPELGEGVYEGEAVRWLVEPGDTVKAGQTVIEVLTDKATMEVPVPFAGVIDKLLINPGDKIEIGQAILEYQEKGASAKPKQDGEHKAKPEAKEKLRSDTEAEVEPETEEESESEPKAKPHAREKPE